MSGMRELQVELGARRYPIRIARGLLDDPAGLAAQARLAWVQGDAALAVSLQRRAMSTFRGPPARWHQVQLEAYLSKDAATAMPPMPRPISESFFPVMR